jgi:hypothetical protein
VRILIGGQAGENRFMSGWDMNLFRAENVLFATGAMGSSRARQHDPKNLLDTR